MTRVKLKTTLYLLFQCLIEKSKCYLSLTSPIRKGYISSEDLKAVFSLLDETVSDEELHSKWIPYLTIFYIAMIKIAGIKSNDKINFKEFVDFFYKVDWIDDPCYANLE